MKKVWLYCIAAFACISFSISASSFAGGVDLLEQPTKNIYYIFIPGSIQGSFGQLDACYYCHGNGGKGTSVGKQKGVPDFTSPEWQSSRTDTQLLEHVNMGSDNCTACRGRISEAAIDKLVAIVRGFGEK
ncbi:MAG: hypothetical protein ACUZ8E_05130 [Candidatus Anammoxibacter sp.]